MTVNECVCVCACVPKCVRQVVLGSGLNLRCSTVW